MWILFKIAWRNIWRNKKRSLVIMVAIALGLTGGNFISATYMGLMNKTVKENIEKQLSHIQLHHPDFIADRNLKYQIPDAQRIAREVRRIPGIQSVAERTCLDGMAASPHLTAGVKITGVIPSREIKTTHFDEQIVEGTYFTEEGRLPSIIIGRELAEDMQSSVGSRIVLTFQDTEGELINASFRVEGIFQATATSFERGTIFVKSNDIKEIIGKEQIFTEIALSLQQEDLLEDIAKTLRQQYPDLSVRTWGELAPDLEFVAEITEKSLLMITAIILLGVAFGILNTILMSVLERTRELGMLMSIGMKRIRVFSMVVLETILLSLTGGAAGLTASFMLVSFLQQRGMNLSSIGGEALRDFGFSPFIYPELDAIYYLKVTAMVVVFAILAAIYPARKATRLEPADAVRHE
ncbi:MAG: ABC transporter permease [Bacteroidales bacterium]